VNDTCHFETCSFAKSLFDRAEECFNFKETWWKPKEGSPICIRDCVPTRTMIMVQEMYNQMIGLQQSVEQSRNQVRNVSARFDIILDHAEKRLLDEGR